MPNPKQTFGLLTAISLVAGCIIGTGVFLKPATIAAKAGSVPLVLLAWFGAGLLSFAGALTYAELTARRPGAGGEYVLIRESYGDFWAYLYGWMRFTIAAPGSAASYAVGAALFLHVVYPYSGHGIKTSHIALGFVCLFTVLNSLTLLVSASVQVTLTGIKIGSLALMFVVLIFFASEAPEASPAFKWPGMTSFAAAVMAALWAYDGWNNLPMLGGEIDRPRRNLPLALGLGMLVVLVIYLGINAAFFRVLNFSEIVALAADKGTGGVPPVATAALAKVISSSSVKIVAILLVISALGAMNGSIMSSARVPFAMARDGFFFPALAKLSSKNSLPVIATITQGLIACVLTLSGSFDELTDSVVFASWLFYGLTAATIFKVRRLDAHRSRYSGFRVPGYPYLPAMFLVCSAAFLVYAVFALPYLTLLGISIILAGTPGYWYFTKRKIKMEQENSED
jgi:basic amino acid/polyamine antiporter, APA family